MMKLSPSTLLEHLPASMSPTKRMQMMEQFCGWVNESINKRGQLQAEIDRHKVNGRIHVVETGRDCDGVEYSHYIGWTDATLSAFYDLYQAREMWADGPFQLHIVPAHPIPKDWSKGQGWGIH